MNLVLNGYFLNPLHLFVLGILPYQKMSLIIPIAFAVVWFDESLGWVKLSGVLAAIAAIILVNFPIKGQVLDFDRKWLILPIVAFVMSGMFEIDL